MVWNGFCTVREQMVIFLLNSFFSIVQYWGRNSKKTSSFLKKNLKNLKSSNSVSWILHYKRALKKIFSDFLLLTFGV